MKLKINEELKALIPPLAEDEYKLLEQSIINEGCRDKIITWDDTIVDGHNRYEICTKHGIPFQVEDRDFENIDDVRVWMITNQFGRRNINNYQRSILALQLEEVYRDKAKANQKTSGENFGKGCQKSDKPINKIDTKKELAKLAHVSHDTIAKVKAIEEKAPNEVKEKLKAGDVSINQAYVEVKRSEKKQQLQQKFVQLKEKENLPIVEHYDVIVIDPPWQMKKIDRDVAPMQVDFDYPTMSIEEIKAFKLPAEKDCHVFMWITQKHLPHGFEIFKEWGVNYILTMVWHKNGGFQPFGLPQYNCEFIMYGKIGNPQFVDLKNFMACFRADRTGHSKKPDTFYETIKRVTAGKRIDIFNRRDIDGFDKWGNEA